ncbi:MAG: hypothetical protein JW820_04715 [Spirochaetales bacterium]|nr:hypothetical protein [Spirochaetales bacterium]
MAQAVYEYAGLSTRGGFNRSLRHFQAVTGILPDFEGKSNLADILNAMLDDKSLEQNQIAPILNALCVGHPKYHYASRSYNLTRNIDDFAAIVAEVSKWNAVDVILAYYHPDLGLTLVNPKNPKAWENVQNLRRNELVTIYCGTLTEKADGKLYDAGIEAMIGLLAGEKVKTPAALTQGKFKWKPSRAAAAPPAAVRRPGRAPAPRGRRPRGVPRGVVAPARGAVVGAPAAAPPVPAAPPAGAKRRMTPMYSIPVTNELFHNGNVEAWKKVIASYNQKYPGLEVFIFYEGERIHDINTLFKWGKVKHGSMIMIAVAGEDIKDVAKLQRYLRQGASPAFEAFLKFPVNTVLNLF